MASSKPSIIRTLSSHLHLLDNLVNGDTEVELTGHSLDLATLIAVACHDQRTSLSAQASELITTGAKGLQASLERKDVIYGINTGFGGNADTRTRAVTELSKDLLRGLQYGIITDRTSTRILPLDHEEKSYLPESWVRATLLIRLNSLAHGASGISSTTVEALLQLLQKNVMPRIPLRGSISASGDLSPLAYVAGTLQGKPSLYAWTGERSKGDRRLEPANIALAENDIAPILLGPKEGLSLVNGTSVSAGVAALALHEALCLSGLSKVLTAMSVEALKGTDESFDPFIAAIRPHWGQAETAQAICRMLKGSSLVFRDHSSEAASLRQDRYSIRTASQWIGPALEDIHLAYQQVVTELNSATDNPLIDTDNNHGSGRVVHGGNFQAKSVTNAMEKVRQSAQTIGRLLFTQCTELINPATSRGLPPNLVVSEPSESFIFKGTDILIAALLSELGFLANPVGSHVQSAEMSNQALNSLALISARYTLDALDILAQLAAAMLVALCQALDLRALHQRFITTFKGEFYAMINSELGIHLRTQELDEIETLQHDCWHSFLNRLDATTVLDASARMSSAVESQQARLLKATYSSTGSSSALQSWTEVCSARSLQVWAAIRTEYSEVPDASPFLGQGSLRMYSFVRHELAIPFVTPSALATPSGETHEKQGVTMGDINGRVRVAMASGSLYKIMVECLENTDASGVLKDPDASQKLSTVHVEH